MSDRWGARAWAPFFFSPRGPTKPQLAQTAGPKNNLLRQNRLLFGWAVWGQGPTQKQPKSTRLVVFSPGSPSGLSWVIAQKTA